MSAYMISCCCYLWRT